jgi:hypothetical protein
VACEAAGGVGGAEEYGTELMNLGKLGDSVHLVKPRHRDSRESLDVRARCQGGDGVASSSLAGITTSNSLWHRIHQRVIVRPGKSLIRRSGRHGGPAVRATRSSTRTSVSRPFQTNRRFRRAAQMYSGKYLRRREPKPNRALNRRAADLPALELPRGIASAVVKMIKV